MTRLPITDYAGHRVVILGMARQGIALARFLLAHGAQVTLSDLRSEHQLAAGRAALCDYAAERQAPAPRFVLGEHPNELLDNTDLLCLSGGVSPALPVAQEARRRGIALSNDSALTLRYCLAPIIGITGSAGKTTTTTLTGLMLAQTGYTVHVGGNIGTPLIDRLEEIGAGHKVVMELSSFQLELFEHSPAIATVLNITPNHLDRHPSMSHYAAAKANILRFQQRGDSCVLSAEDTLYRRLAAQRPLRDSSRRRSASHLFSAAGDAVELQLEAGGVQWRLPGRHPPDLAPRRPTRYGNLSHRTSTLARPAQPGQYPGRLLFVRRSRRYG